MDIFCILPGFIYISLTVKILPLTLRRQMKGRPMSYEKTELNTVKRGGHKARYDKMLIHEILDAVEVCHVAFNIEGRAQVQPVNFGRSGETLYIHGSPKNRMTRALIESGEACLSVMILDSMKLTRSAFHHSVNFRSVVVFGRVEELKSDEQKVEGLKTIINHFVPGRWEHCRPPTKKELKATRVIAIHIESASAKVADGEPTDEREDYDSGYWAGVIPVTTVYGYPRADSRLKPGLSLPGHVLDFYRAKNKKS